MSCWLVIATSARMLAQAAQREGYDVLAIDCYADVDTKRYAKRVVRVYSLSVENIKAALKPLEKYTITGVVYGSGFETFPESLHFLQNHFPLLGNSPDVFERVQNKKIFFAALQSLNIPYPETQFNIPASSHSQTWLSKPLNGQGGVGISFDNSNKINVYWQHYCEGQAGSVLFLADKNKTTVIGFHRQWTQSIGENDFLFAGICHDDSIS
ncbi:MAG: ATP-grasp domain-containing protein, partial [Methylococcales bacterium]|nr:ATP-grasp domain-containing protein [Methylococcales bacterium]